MKPPFDVVVIGGGAGGLVVAAAAATIGAKVALVEKHRLGGDCLWSGCVPSKALLATARLAQAMREADRLGLSAVEPRPDLVRAMTRVQSVIDGIAPHDSPERFRALGVDVVEGDGAFESPDAFVVGDRRLAARRFVLATGARPALPPLPGLDRTPHLTHETLFALREPVRHLAILGAGAVGAEMAQAFRRLGSDVTLIDVAPRLLPREDDDVAAVVQQRLAREGVTMRLGVRVLQAEGAPGAIRVTIREADGTPRVVAATHLLVATGRVPNVERLGLDRADVALRDGRLVMDGVRTTHPAILAIGDVTGGPQYTHLAEHHAQVAIRHAIFRQTWVKPSAVVPACTFTDPELARVGTTEHEAKAQGLAYRVHTFPYVDLDRARTDGATEGFAKLIATPRGRLLGAAIVGAHAGELLPELVLAMGRRGTLGDIGAAMHAYPTYAQVTRRAADRRLHGALTQARKAWIRRLFGLRG